MDFWASDGFCCSSLIHVEAMNKIKLSNQDFFHEKPMSLICGSDSRLLPLTPMVHHNVVYLYNNCQPSQMVVSADGYEDIENIGATTKIQIMRKTYSSDSQIS